MRRVLLVLIALSALVFLGLRLRYWLASDATRIRWRLEEMEAGFDGSRLAPCLRGISTRWRDETTGLDRGLLGDALRSLFFTEVDPKTGRFRYDVELPPETLLIEPDPEDEGHARVDVVAVFSEREGEAWKVIWRVRIHADMEDDPDHGWQVVRSEHETLEGDAHLGRGG